MLVCSYSWSVYSTDSNNSYRVAGGDVTVTKPALPHLGRHDTEAASSHRTHDDTEAVISHWSHDDTLRWLHHVGPWAEDALRQPFIDMKIGLSCCMNYMSGLLKLTNIISYRKAKTALI